MRSITMAAVVALLVGGMAMGDTTITYSIYLGGDNQEASWGTNYWPPFLVTGSSDADGQDFTKNQTPADDPTWEVRVFVSGVHDAPDEDYDGLVTAGAANLVFDLEIVPVTGVDDHAGACANDPVSDAGDVYYSSMNTGVGARPDLEMAAFCVSFDAERPNVEEGYPPVTPYYPGGYPDGVGVVTDWEEEPPVELSAGSHAFDGFSGGGPKMNRVQYPTTSYFPQLPDEACAPDPPPCFPNVDPGKLAGMGCGYQEFNFASGYVAGVGIYPYELAYCQRGLNAWILGDPDPLEIGTPIFEGQIKTDNLDAGFYALRLTPGTGNNVMRGDISCRDPLAAGHFAVAADNVVVSNNTCTGESTIQPGHIIFEIKAGGPTPVTVNSWKSRRTHTMIKEPYTVEDLDITLNHDTTDPPEQPPPRLDENCGTSEPREGGMQLIVVSLSGDAGSVTGTIQARDMSDLEEPFTYIDADDAWLGDSNPPTEVRDILFIEFEPETLSDIKCYKIDLTGTLGATITGDADCRIVNLYGDADGDYNNTLTDYLRVKDHVPPIAPPWDELHIRADVDLDYDLTLTDYLRVKDNVPHAVKCPDCP